PSYRLAGKDGQGFRTRGAGRERPSGFASSQGRHGAIRANASDPQPQIQNSHKISYGTIGCVQRPDSAALACRKLPPCLRFRRSSRACRECKPLTTSAQDDLLRPLRGLTPWPCQALRKTASSSGTSSSARTTEVQPCVPQALGTLL